IKRGLNKSGRQLYRLRAGLSDPEIASMGVFGIVLQGLGKRLETAGIKVDTLVELLRTPQTPEAPVPAHATAADFVWPRAAEFPQNHRATLTALRAEANRLGQVLSRAMRDIDCRSRRVLIRPLNPPAAKEYVRRRLWHYYYNYDDYDTVLFPILFGTAV